MKKNFTLLFCVMAVLACNKGLIGKYIQKNKNVNFRQRLILNSDSTCVYEWMTDIRMTCNGKWTIKGDTIFIIGEPYGCRPNERFVIINKQIIGGKNNVRFKKQYRILKFLWHHYKI